MSDWKDNHEQLLYAGEAELKEALAIAQSLSCKILARAKRRESLNAY